MVERADAVRESASKDARDQLIRNGYGVISKLLPVRPGSLTAGEVKSTGIDPLVVGDFGYSPILGSFDGSTTTMMVRGTQVCVLMFW